ncbi:MAG: ligase-associated DNA damage response exonuclease [Elainellaceae cyanobacterium]
MAIISIRPEGLYCSAGDFYIDPWRAVDRALITHAHADHARTGAQRYWATQQSEGILRKRLGQDIDFQGVTYGDRFQLGRAVVSFHPAGHVLGSAQVRVEVEGEVWVISGDYKRDADPTCTLFEPVVCDTFITEATFGLPIYRWQSGAATAQQIHDWWQAAPERPSLLFCYSFGKAQRVLAELTQLTRRPIYVHGAIAVLNEIYRQQGIDLGETVPTTEVPKTHSYQGDLILAPPSGHRSSWMKRFKQPQTAFASGWMAVRGARRRRGYERGFVLSDHADWPGLVQTVKETQAEKIYVTHGQSDTLARYLREALGLDAEPLETLFEGEGDV